MTAGIGSRMLVSEFVEKHPLVFHMAAAGTWPQIQTHGLLSTSALLDHFELTHEQRFAIESVRCFMFGGELGGRWRERLAVGGARSGAVRGAASASSSRKARGG
jgi:uncharacterized protein DUF7002